MSYLEKCALPNLHVQAYILQLALVRSSKHYTIELNKKPNIYNNKHAQENNTHVVCFADVSLHILTHAVSQDHRVAVEFTSGEISVSKINLGKHQCSECESSARLAQELWELHRCDDVENNTDISIQQYLWVSIFKEQAKFNLEDT